MTEKRTRPPLPNRRDEVSNERVSLPVYIAYCGIARSLRFFDRESSRFFAILVLPPDADKDLYKIATQLFLRRLVEPERFWKGEENVCVAEDMKGVKAFLLAMRGDRDWRRVVLLVTDKAHLTPELELAADHIAALDHPASRHYKAAAWRFHGHLLTELELRTIRAQPMVILRAAFRSGRSFGNAYRKLVATIRSGRHESEVDKLPLQQEGPSLRDLPGYGEAKHWGLELARDVADWRAGKLSWSDVDRGALLTGPPGTGKSLYAKALANTIGVPIVHASVGKWQEAGYLNDNLKAMTASFTEAKAVAPSVLFVDEIDAIGSRLSAAGHNAESVRQVISRFLLLVDELFAQEGVVLLAASNYPHLIDEAMKRSGRLDRQFAIPLPDASARPDIFKYHAGIELDGRKLVDFTRRSAGMTGADIERTVREAKRKARRANDVFSADHVIALLPVFRRLSTQSLKMVSVHELGHAIVALQIPFAHLNGVAISDEILESGDNEIAGFASISIDGGAPRDRKYYLDMISIDLAGIAAEQEVFGSFVDGAGGEDRADLVRATYRATLFEAVYGFGGRLTSIATNETEELAKLRASDPLLDQAVQSLLSDRFEHTRALIASNRDALDELSELLLRVSRLSAEDIIKVVSRHGGILADPPGWLEAKRSVPTDAA